MIDNKRKWNKLEHLVLKVSLYGVHQLDRCRIQMHKVSGGWLCLLPYVDVKGTYYMNRLDRLHEIIIRGLFRLHSSGIWRRAIEFPLLDTVSKRRERITQWRGVVIQELNHQLQAAKMWILVKNLSHLPVMSFEIIAVLICLTCHCMCYTNLLLHRHCPQSSDFICNCCRKFVSLLIC